MCILYIYTHYYYHNFLFVIYSQTTKKNLKEIEKLKNYKILFYFILPTIYINYVYNISTS